MAEQGDNQLGIELLVGENGGYPTVEEIADRLAAATGLPTGGCESLTVYAFADGALTYSAQIFDAAEREGGYLAGT